MSLAALPPELGVVMLVLGVLLCAALLGFARRWLAVPISVGMLAAGLALGKLAGWAATLPSKPNLLVEIVDVADIGYRTSPELILYVFLPPLIFEAAHGLSIRRLKKDLGVIAVLALPVLIVSAISVASAALLFGGEGFGLSWTTALLLGVVVSATDPVAVLAAFRELGAPPRLSTLIEGESLCNDGTAIVIHQALCGVVLAGGAVSASGALAQTGLQLIGMVAGGLALGGAASWLCFRLLGPLAEEHVEISISLVVAYGTFLVAEHLVGVSGVLATLGAGLVAASYGRSRLSPDVSAFTSRFWKYVAFIMNALIFLLVGLVIALRVPLHALYALLPLLGVVVVAAFVARAASVHVVVTTLKRFGDPLDPRFGRVMIWGGLRGGVSLALALHVAGLEGVPEEAREAILVLTSGVVLVTLLFCGTTIRPLLKSAGLGGPTPLERLQLALAELKLCEAASHAVSARPVEEPPGDSQIAEELDERRAEARWSISVLMRELEAGPEALPLVAAKLALSVERSALEQLHSSGEIHPAALAALTNAADELGDRLHAGDDLPEDREIEARTPLERTAVNRGFVLLANRVIETLAGQDETLEVPFLAEVRGRYEGWRDSSQLRLRNPSHQPDGSSPTDGDLLARLQAIRMEESKAASLEQSGLLDPKAAHDMRRQLAARERDLVRAIEEEGKQR